MADMRKQDSLSSFFEDPNNLLNHFPGIIFWKDLRLCYRGCNYAFAKFLRLPSPKYILGKTDEVIDFSPSIRDVILKDEQHILHSRKPITKEYAFTSPNGSSPVNFLVKKIPLFRSNGEFTGILTVANQLGDGKAHLPTPVLHEKFDSQGQTDLITNMSHDLKTPLNSILGMAEVLKMQNPSPEQYEFIEGIEQSGKTLLQLVDNILNYNKIESGKVDLNNSAFSIKQMVEEVLNTTSHQARQNNIELITYFSDAIPDKVISDAGAIRRILINLVSNAIKFTRKGHVLVSVEDIEISDSVAKLQISVEDTGIGISQENLQHIFDRFYRANPTYTGDYPGTGLGLSIAKQLAEDLGGDLNVNSKLNAGSTFWCSLPFKIESARSSDGEWRKEHPHTRVLIIDEHHVRSQILAKQIAPLECTIEEGNDAINTFSNALYGNTPYHIVIIDDELRDISPLTLADRLLTFCQNGYKPILVLCTNNRSLIDKERAKAVGFQHILKKPIQPSELLRSLSSACDNWSVETPPSLSRQKNHVLLIEDDMFAQKFSKAMLEKLNCDVTIAATGQQAIELTSHYHYDTIFVDIGLPDVSGLEVISSIRGKQTNGSRKSRIVALTAHANTMDKNLAEKAGTDYFIPKPASFSDFENTLHAP